MEHPYREQLRGYLAAHPAETGAAFRPDTGQSSQRASVELVGYQLHHGLVDHGAGKPILSMDTSTVTLSSPDCQGALYTSQDPVYAGTGYTGVSGLVSSEPGDNYDHWVNQAVILFPSADKAKSFMETAAGRWKGCARKTVTVTNKGKTYRWTFAQINGTPPKMTVLDTQEGADGWECQRAMSQANNVIVDINACGYHISDQGGQITDKIVAKVDNE